MRISDWSSDVCSSDLAMNDLLGGQVDAFFASAPTVMSQQDNPRIRALAITTLQSIPQLPKVPPLADTLPGFEAASKTGLIMPAGPPKEMVEAVNKAVNQALTTKKLRYNIMDEGNVVLVGQVNEFTHLSADESDNWYKII